MSKPHSDSKSKKKGKVVETITVAKGPGKQPAKKWHVGASLPSVTITGIGSSQGGGLNFGSGVSPSAPMTKKSALGMKNSSRGGTCAEIDFIASVTTGSSSLVNSIITQFDLNPQAIPVPRLNAMAAMYKRYRIKSLVALYTPILTPLSANSGDICMYFQDDASEPDPFTGQNGLRVALGHKASDINSMLLKWALAWKGKSEWLYCEPDVEEPRLSSPGKLFLTMGSAITTALSIGNLEVAYVYEFSEASLGAIQGSSTNVLLSRYLSGLIGSSAANPFGTTIGAFTFNGLSAIYNGGSSFTWPTQPGRLYYVALDFQGAVVAVPFARTLVGLSESIAMASDGAVNAAGTAGLWAGVYAATGDAATFVFSLTTFTTPSRAEFFIYPYGTLAAPKPTIKSLTDDVASLKAALAEIQANQTDPGPVYLPPTRLPRLNMA